MGLFFSSQATEHTPCTAFGFVVVIWSQGDVKFSEVKPKMSYLRIKSQSRSTTWRKTGAKLKTQSELSWKFKFSFLQIVYLKFCPWAHQQRADTSLFRWFRFGFGEQSASTAAKYSDANLHNIDVLCFLASPGPSSWRWRLEKWQKKKRGTSERWAGA